MGKGKGAFDHWATLVPPGKMLFEILAPDMRPEIAKEAVLAAAVAIPGPVHFINKAALRQPAVRGFKSSPEYHAGIKVDGPIDLKLRLEEKPPVVVSPQIGRKKLAKMRKGLVR